MPTRLEWRVVGLGGSVCGMSTPGWSGSADQGGNQFMESARVTSPELNLSDGFPAV